MTRLTDTQLVILSAAAARDGGALLPLPPAFNLNKGSATRVLRGLVRKGLAAEIAASLDDAIWRLDENSDRLTLIITDQGLGTLGIKSHVNGRSTAMPDENAPRPARASNDNTSRPATIAESPNTLSVSPSSKHPHSKPATKIGIVVDLLRRGEGATIADMTAATGWQAHSVRGVLSGTIRKKLGHNLTSQAIEGRGRVYHIATDGSGQ